MAGQYVKQTAKTDLSPVNDRFRRLVDEALADPRPNVPARQVFKRLRAHHARSARTKGNEKG
jgi:hypothetical protein